MADHLTKIRGVPAAMLTRLGRPLPIRVRGAAVLCYHDIGPDPTNATDYFVAPSLLAAHLDWVREWGYTIVPLAEIVDRLLAGRDLDGLLAITFDDALVGVVDHAAAILESAGAPATVFVVTGVLGIDPPFWPDAARTMTADELATVTASGLISLGSHTAHHASLPDIPTGDRDAELVDSRTMLLALGARDADVLACPSGHHDAATQRAAADAGYRAACTFSFGRVTPRSDLMAMPRFCIGPVHDRFRLSRQLARVARAW